MAPNRSSRAGSILLLVLMSIVIMSLATSSYLVLMRSEHSAMHNAGQQMQARMLVESGVDYLCLFLDQTDTLITQQGGLLANASAMQGVLVSDDPVEDFRGRFTVMSPDVIDGYYSGVRYGLEDESSKLNLNLLVQEGSDETATRDRLMFIPGMTQEVADAILDWIDADNVPRAYGAEDTYYQGLAPAYQPRNGPLQSLDELLQVRGVTPDLLYGIDANRNLTVDGQEQARGALLQIDNSLGQMNRGWSAYFTVYAAERNFNPTGTAKININNSDLTALQTELQQVVDVEAANFIIAYRQFGPMQEDTSGGTGSGGGGSAATLSLNLQTEPTTDINSLLDLVGARVSVQENSSGQPSGDNPPNPSGGGGPPSEGPPQPGQGGQVVNSPWQDGAALYSGVFLDLLDKLTTTDESARGGRININRATRPVLLTVPFLTEIMADQIVTMRETEVDRQISPQRHAIWLLANGVVTLEQMKQLDPFITATGDVYSGQIVGFFDAKPARSRASVIFDRTDTKTLLVGWDDLTKLGPGFTAAELGAPVVGP